MGRTLNFLSSLTASQQTDAEQDTFPSFKPCPLLLSNHHKCRPADEEEDEMQVDEACVRRVLWLGMQTMDGEASKGGVLDVADERRDF